MKDSGMKGIYHTDSRMRDYSKEVQDAFNILNKSTRYYKGVSRFLNYSIKSLMEVHKRTGNDQFLDLVKQVEQKVIEISKEVKREIKLRLFIYEKDSNSRYGSFKRLNPSTGTTVNFAKDHEMFPLEMLGELKEYVAECEKDGHEIKIRKVPENKMS